MIKPKTPVTPGSYVVNPAGYGSYQNEDDWRADNYVMTISSDKRSLEESFDIGGKHYHLTYAMTVHSVTQ